MTRAEEAAATEAFERVRPRLLGLAYRMLGTRADAEDVVQDAWLKWQGARPDDVDRPEAWLTTTTTRLAIDRLRTLRRRREEYLGPWLAEPVVAGPEEAVELCEALTLGFLTVLDRLSPTERAVFLLADVFRLPYTEIAAAVGKTDAACRQIASRARRRIRQPDARPVVDGDRAAVGGFLSAMAAGDVEGALRWLAPGVVCVTDLGPRRGGRRPVRGAERVARTFVHWTHRYDGRAGVAPAVVNGQIGIVMYLDGDVDSVAAFEVDDERITRVWIVRNPEKLARLGEPADLR
jgi:RNA polymerase sigma-70 factor (ECF subfamily)